MEQKIRKSIKEWPLDERPREKAVKNGISSLSNSELMAMLIGSGTPDESAVELMQKVLASCNDSIARLARLTVDDLCLFKGIGPAKALTIVAACELWKRREGDDITRTKYIKSSQDLFRYFHPMLCDLNVEQCHVLMLNSKNGVIDSTLIGSGGLTATTVDIRLVIREALMKRATAIALCHNHPSGNINPSRDDNELTKNLRDACRVMNIRFLDHIIVAGDRYYSYIDESV
jgi:DNA repair protein RadC